MQDRTPSSLTGSGTVDLAYTNEQGTKLGFQFSSVPEKAATLVIAAFASASQNVTQSDDGNAMVSHTEYSSTKGGGDMNERIARLESDVGHIKTDIHAIREDTRKFMSDAADSKRDVAVILQSLHDITTKLDKKAGKDEVEAKIVTSANRQILWTIGSLLTIVGIAATIIIKALSVN